MKLFREYIKLNIVYITLYILFLAVFASVGALYSLPAEPLIYSSALTLFFGVIAFAAGFVRFYRRQKGLERKLDKVPLDLTDLPDARTPAETVFAEIAGSLARELKDARTRFLTEKQESVDYYTTWAHQIKTPISVMQMTLTDDTEENRALSAELFRIEQYVEMVLSFVRLGSDSSDLVIKECALDPLIRQSIRKFAPFFIRRRIGIQYTPTDKSAVTDEKWFAFIIEQLLSNAVKYTFSGSVTVSVGEDCSVTVADTGIGIAPEDLPRIFEKGFTGYNGRADKKSTGLGLYLSRQAADKISAEITAVSEPGKGSAFTVRLKSAEGRGQGSPDGAR